MLRRYLCAHVFLVSSCLASASFATVKQPGVCNTNDPGTACECSKTIRHQTLTLQGTCEIETGSCASCASGASYKSFCDCEGSWSDFNFNLKRHHYNLEHEVRDRDNNNDHGNNNDPNKK